MSNKKKLSLQLGLLASCFALMACEPNTTQNTTDTPSASSEAPAKGSAAHIKTITAAIDDARLAAADANQGDWLSYGRNYSEDRYSKLDQITKDNLDELGIAWTLDLGTKRGIQSTPIVVDGVMFFTGPWSVVYAVDARKGEIIWTYDPEVTRKKAMDMCCGVVNRGLAIYKGAVFVGTMDGRLISVDAATGEPNWSVATFDPDSNYSITGAPRIANGKVVIGNGGAELAYTRGYVTAYDAETGEQAWRFYTVPGNPNEPLENPVHAMSAETWTGDWWKWGGGGTVWDSIVYDPEFNSVYIGVGNGTPWDREIRSPDGGDNLFLSSIVALDADTGEYKWHYQTTPGDTWDYTATQPIMLADMEIDGAPRKVLMQAPKNGFFYVIDRETGEFISGEPYAYTNWAKSLDENGRPIEEPGTRYLDGKTWWIAPSSHGAHNWFPMALNHETGLVYIPGVKDVGPYYHNKDVPLMKEGGILPGNDFQISVALKLFNEPVVDPNATPPGIRTGELIAYDPIKQERVWSVPRAGYYNGGVLTTTTGLVLQGDAEGNLNIHDAATGDVLKQIDIRGGSISSPVTYLVDGEQYVTLLVGWGGGQGQTHRKTDTLYPGTIYTFKLGGDAPAPEKIEPVLRELSSLSTDATPIELGWGFTYYSQNCTGCHGIPGESMGGVLPNLAYASDAYLENLEVLLLEGALADQGMPIHDHLVEEQVQGIADYIIFMAQSMREGKTYPEMIGISAGLQAQAWEAGLPEYLQEGHQKAEESAPAPAPQPTQTATPEPISQMAEDAPAATAAVTLGDAAKGEKAARVCSSCHTFDKGGPNRVGPNLWGVVGREIASVDGVRYSKTLQGLEGVWTLEELDAFIKSPKAYAPGTTMGIGAPQDAKRADILAYLQTLKDE